MLKPRTALFIATILLLSAQEAASLQSDVSSQDAANLHQEAPPLLSAAELAQRAVGVPGLSRSLKPGYHITPPSGWMNDPNAPAELHGIFHLFYQYNPNAPVWAAPYWGHEVSTDLVHWQEQPIALAPDTWYDGDGVFSGSATLLANGTPAILYTGVSRFAELGWFYATQVLATPADPADPLLRRWVKQPSPAIATAPPRGNHAQWRDPTTAVWVPDGGAGQNGSYFMAVGAQIDCQGAAVMYEAGPGFDSWKYRGLFASVSSVTAGGACPKPKAAMDEGGPVSCPAEAQFAAGCPVWECPDWFELGGGISVFKFSDQVATRQPFAQDWYVLSDRPLDWASLSGKEPAAAGAAVPALFSNLLGNKTCAPQLLEHGHVYASKAFKTSDGRVVWWGWAYETSVGCGRMCSEGTPFTEALGWQGAQTLPREITYDPASRSLLLNPVKEVEKLRQGQLFNGNVTLQSDGQAVSLVAAGPSTPGSEPVRQMELIVYFNLSALSTAPASSKPSVIGNHSASAGHDTEPQILTFTLGAAVDFGGGLLVEARLTGKAANSGWAASGCMQVTEVEMWVDTRQAGGATQPGFWGGPMPLAPGGLSAQELQLRLFVDRSLIEVYGLGGRQRTTVRAYPLDPEASWGLSLFAQAPAGGAAVAARASIWELGSCWVGQD